MGNFEKRNYIIDKFNAKVTFLNSCVFVKEILYIGTEGVYSKRLQKHLIFELQSQTYLDYNDHFSFFFSIYILCV
jgi:hypothetical protein